MQGPLYMAAPCCQQGPAKPGLAKHTGITGRPDNSSAISLHLWRLRMWSHLYSNVLSLSVPLMVQCLTCPLSLAYGNLECRRGLISFSVIGLPLLHHINGTQCRFIWRVHSSDPTSIFGEFWSRMQADADGRWNPDLWRATRGARSVVSATCGPPSPLVHHRSNVIASNRFLQLRFQWFHSNFSLAQRDKVTNPITRGSEMPFAWKLTGHKLADCKDPRAFWRCLKQSDIVGKKNNNLPPKAFKVSEMNEYFVNMGSFYQVNEDLISSYNQEIYNGEKRVLNSKKYQSMK
ncbi:hypothetical protein J6590_046628 [Homalodisca vitripennis]|nr:hypothetical protein J6590_046628 [Homalodisca vitripennis]